MWDRLEAPQLRLGMFGGRIDFQDGKLFQMTGFLDVGHHGHRDGRI